MPSCIVNGEGYSFAAPFSVAALLKDMRLTGKKVAVEKNGVIVPKSVHEKEAVAAGDVLEIVTAVGGG